MAKEHTLLSRLGSNLAESMGANRAPRPDEREGRASAPAASTRHDGCTRLRSAAEIELNRITPDSHQPRTEFDAEAIDRLAESLKTHGQLQPISVRWSEDMGRYLIVTGERRWRAAVQAGRPTIAAVILDGQHTDAQILEMQIIENCLREDLRPVEQARAFQGLMDRNGWSAARLAEVLHLTGATVSRALALLDLPYTVQAQVDQGELAPSVAYEVSKIEDPAEQAEVAAQVVAEGLTREQAGELVRRRSGRSSQNKGARPAGRKGRGGPAVFRTATGVTVTVARTRGKAPVSDADILAALAEIQARLGEGAADQAA
jgi:ParB family chromosome partitioning protein